MNRGTIEVCDSFDRKRSQGLIAAGFFGGHMPHHLFTAAIFIAALALYGSGMISGAWGLFAAAFACELWFWARMRARRRHA
jgi:hypothetical protein